jgi:hypothetical protein|nr:hypothetical protein [Kofleriaceae bacterium]
MRKRLLVPLLFAAACSSALADQAATVQPPPGAQVPQAQIALANAPAKVRAPYDVQVMREDGETLPTYGLKDRYYVQGNAGDRYVIRVTNPTPNRVEAVVTVDGLDVIDGESGDLHKRGYVIPPYGETRIEGFRTSSADVATFRFSSVSDSYAGLTGKARNVGVIAVALFEEQHVEPQQIVTPDPETTAQPGRPYDYRDDLSKNGEPTTEGTVAHAERSRRAPPPQDAPSSTPSGGVGGASAGRGAPAAPAQTMPPPPPRHVDTKKADKDDNYGDDTASQGEDGNYEAQQKSRPGLGTEYGEQRYSAASFTRFVRSADRPIAIAELRYNDAAGLTALGIPVQPLPDQGEIMTRETADPFPGDAHYSQPPR